MKKNVLLAVHTVTYFNELARVAKAVHASGRYQPFFIFPHSYPSRDRHISIALKEGFTCLDAYGKEIPRVEVADRPSEPSLKRFIASLNNRSFDSFFFELWYLLHRIRFVRKVIRSYNIRLLILGGDLTHYDTSSFIRAAKKQSIPSVIVPCALLSGPLDVAETILPIRKYHLSRWQNKLFAKYHPKWVYTHKGRPLLRLPAERALAMHVLQLAPPLPWINLSGFADCIAVESKAMFDFYLGQGIPKSQLHLTGLPGDDALYSNLKNAPQLIKALCSRMGMPPHKKIILCALPPDQFYMIGAEKGCEFQRYHDLVRFWIQTLASTEKYNVLIGLHPSTSHEDIKPFERPGIKIIQDDIVSFIPLCDIFVASISSVIRWAIACGKPVLNYDVYRLRYEDYKDVGGVLTMEKKEEFQNIFQALTHDEQYYEELETIQLHEANRWGKLDGKAQERLLLLFDSLTRNL